MALTLSERYSIKELSGVLLEAAEHGVIKLCTKLLKQCNFEQTVLAEAFYLAAKNNHIDIVELLFPLVKDKDARTRAMGAAHVLGHLEVTQYLVNQGCQKELTTRLFDLFGL